MTVCACCGRPTAGAVPLDELQHVPLGPVEQTIVACLVRAFPKPVSSERLIETVYTISNEPETAKGVITVTATRLRKKLKQYGWTIPRRAGGRGVRAAYRLEQIDGKAI